MVGDANHRKKSTCEDTKHRIYGRRIRLPKEDINMPRHGDFAYCADDMVGGRLL
jgi:hypothetical protein